MNTSRIPLPELPPRLAALAGIAANLSWSWSRDAHSVFRALDPVLWHQTRHNPIELLQRVSSERLAASAADPDFLRLYDAVCGDARREADTADTWFTREAGDRSGATIAYFCAEFGLDASVPIYAGGLGVLAGDHCKAASVRLLLRRNKPCAREHHQSRLPSSSPE